jgi:phosphoribosylaminoimidazole-succinocarboxamide synthase
VDRRGADAGLVALWPKDLYQPGRAQPSFDKQYVRDYLETLQWDKRPPAPSLPPEVVDRTRGRDEDALRRLTDGPPRRSTLAALAT